MLQYRTNAGERRKPALGRYGELTVEQARSLAQNWLAEVRQGGDRGVAKAEARKAPTVKELCAKFMEDYSRHRNKPSTQRGYQGNIDHKIIPILGRMKHRPVTDGQRVAGIYRHSVMLVSGRYAMLNDGMGFSLVPWKPVIEPKLGQQIAATVRGDGVSWDIVRTRAPTL